MVREGNHRQDANLPPAPDISNIILSRIDSSIDVLAEQEPEQLLALAREHLANKKECAKEYEAHRHAEEQGRQHIIQSALAAVTIIFLAAFVYSGMTKSEGLSEKVIDTMLGVLGGGGAVAAVVASSRGTSNGDNS